MEVLESILLLILLVSISNIISHYLVAIPTALIEIAIGFLAAIFLNLTIELETDWFMLLFIAPLLYSDAKHFPKKDLWELRAPIFANAIWLVLLTTLIGGYFINLLVPELSLPLAFALAAVLSPTDPVAVQGIAEQVKLPKKLLNLVNGESLINDASGLITFKYALAAFITGQFSLPTATLDFASLIIISIIVGFIFSKILYGIEFILLRQGIQDVILHTILQILTPFIIFIIAEHFHGSGIIAVVVSGVMAVQQKPLYRSQLSEIQIVTNNLWDIITYLLNGVIFIILGASLPNAMRSAIVNPSISNYNLIFYVVIIWLILLFIRIFWSYGYMWLNYWRTGKLAIAKPRFYQALLTGLTGVRGAITMVMVLSLPFYLPSGDQFAERYLLIFLASGVILSSLLAAVIFLPILTKNKAKNLDTLQDTLDEIDNFTEIDARTLMTQQAITVLKNERNAENENVITELLDDLDKQIRYLYLNNKKTSNEEYHKYETKYRKIAIESEYEAVLSLAKEHNIQKRLLKSYLNMLNFKKKSHTSNLGIVIKQSLYQSKRLTKRLIAKAIFKREHDNASYQKELTLLEKKSAQHTINVLEHCKNELNKNDEHYELERNIINQIALEYQSKIARILHLEDVHSKQYNQLYRDLYLKTLDEERAVIQNLLEKGKVTPVLANQLRQTVNYNETTFLQGNID